MNQNTRTSVDEDRVNANRNSRLQGRGHDYLWALATITASSRWVR